MVELSIGRDRVVVDPDDGGRLTSMVLAGRERLVGDPGPAAGPASTFQWGCFLMAPWAGRIRDAGFDQDGTRARLEPRLAGHALHGLVAERRWAVRTATPDRLELACRLDDAPWPFTGARVVHALALAPGRLDLDLEVTAGPNAMPAWVGWHPCFRRPDDDDVRVRVLADHVLVTDDATVPTGDLAPVAGPTDLRRGPWLGDRRLDVTYPDVVEPATITWPDLELSLAPGPGIATFVVFTPPTHLCLEPQSGWPDAVHLAARHGPRTGLARLAPGATLEAATTWSWRRPD